MGYFANFARTLTRGCGSRKSKPNNRCELAGGHLTCTPVFNPEGPGGPGVETLSLFKTILFPTDFSPGASCALAHALRLADLHEGEIIVQHVVSDYFERMPHWTTIFDLHELQKHLDVYVDTEMQRIVPQDRVQGLRLRKLISKGKPAPEIRAAAELEMVDLIVMGPAGGTVTSKVIEEGTQPVFAIPVAEPNGDKSGRIQRILVATDFSPRSQKVVDYAFALRQSLGATLHVLYVIEMTKAVEFAIRQAHFSNAVERMREWASNQLVNMTPDQFIADPDVHRIVEVGSPSAAITRVAEETRADVIVLGVHEHGRLQKHLVGSNTEKVLEKSGSPILTLRF